MANRIINLIKIILIPLIALFLFMLFMNISIRAANIDNETVMNDLKQDKTFNEERYPDNPSDYSIQVIQLAETKENDIVLYCYQPAHKTIDLVAKKISISYGFTSDGKNLDPKLYDLELLSTNSVFDKYKIVDYAVPGDGQRYYNLVAIYREINTLIDSNNDNEYYDDTLKSYSVGQQWYAYDVNNSKAYEMATFNTMEVNTNLSSHITFNNGIQWGNFVGSYQYGDCWYIAFNCEDYVIKHIYNADLTYDRKHITNTITLGASKKTESNITTNNKLTLSDTDKMTFTGKGLLARNFSWNRILSSSDFIKNLESNKVSLNDDAKNLINQSQWVFTFLETERTLLAVANGTTEGYDDIDNVGVLRLDFIDTTGTHYDLGVVNTLTNPNNNSSGVGNNKILDSLSSFFETILKLVGLIILILIIIALSSVITPIGMIFKYIVKAVLYVLKLPFKIIKWTFNKKR